MTEADAEHVITDLEAAARRQALRFGALTRAPDPDGGWKSADLIAMGREVADAARANRGAGKAWMQRDMTGVRWRVRAARKHIAAFERYAAKVRSAFADTAHWRKVETWDTHSAHVPYLGPEVRESKVSAVRPHLDAITQLDARMDGLHTDWKAAVSADDQARARSVIGTWLDLMEDGLRHHKAAMAAARGSR